MPIDIYLIALFVIAGAVVSLDVSGLTLSKSRYFHDHPDEIRAWWLSNSIWHAGLLLIYIAVISGVFGFFPEFLLGIADLVREILARLRIDLEFTEYFSAVAQSIVVHAPVLLGIFALCILWSTYSDKIVSVPSSGSIGSLSPVARLAFNIGDLCIRLLLKKKLTESRLVRLVYWQAQAALVAVDMLALAALLKSMQVLNAWNASLLVCAIVFIVVGLLTAAAGNYGRTAYARMNSSPESQWRRKSQDWILVSIRLGEPFLIFYFAIQLVAFLIFGRQIHSVSFFLASALLVAALVSRHSLPLVIERTLADPPEEQPALDKLRPIRSVLSSMKEDLAKILRWAFVAFLAILAFSLFLYLKDLIGSGTGSPKSISLESEISLFLGFIKGIGICLVLLNIKAFHHLEDVMVLYLESIVKNSHAYLFVVIALFIAAIFPIHAQLLEGLNQFRASATGPNLGSLGIVENHKHVLQLSLWLLYLLMLSGACTVIRERWSVEIAEADSDDRKSRSLLWRVLFVSFYAFASILLGLIGKLQSSILPTN